MRSLLLSVLGLSLLGSGAFANEDFALVAPEADSCEVLLTKVGSLALTEEIKDILLDDASVEKVVQAMKRSGEIYSDDFERKLRAQLRLGALFMEQGIMHEAIYEVFKARYRTDAEITDAINSYYLISSPRDKAVLLGEVTERVLQFIPNINADNVNQAKELAAYLNMSEEEMARFHSRWVVFDEMNEFVETVVGGINSVLNTHYPQLIQSVLARGGLRYKWARLRHKIEVPMPPVGNRAVTERMVLLTNQQRYASEALMTYLQQSTVAARRFFVLNNRNLLSLEQLDWVLDHALDLELRPGNIEVLRASKVERRQLSASYAALNESIGDSKEVEAMINRARNIEPYDLSAFQRQVNTLRQNEDVKSATRGAIGLIEEYKLKVDSARYVNVVSTIVSAISSRLGGSGSAILQLVTSVVAAGNVIGLEESHAQKVKKILSDLANLKSTSKTNEISDALRVLNVRTPKFLGQSVEALLATQASLVSQIEAQRAVVDTQLAALVKP